MQSLFHGSTASLHVLAREAHMGMCVKRGALSRMFGLGYASGVCFGVCFGV